MKTTPDAGKPAPTDRPDANSLGPVLLQHGVIGYVALLPIAHLISFEFKGIWMTGADALLGGVILLGTVEFFRGTPNRAIPRPPDPGEGAAVAPGIFLLLFSGWVAASATWSFHPTYALLKGLGFAGLSVGVICIGSSQLPWRKALDAWLVGTVIVLVVTWVGVFVGPEILRERVVFGGGLPFPRIRGPFLHPNLFGGYLVVSGVLLWTRWRDWRRDRSALTVVFASLLTGTFFTTVSSAAVQAGVVMVLLGLAITRRRAREDVAQSSNASRLHLRRAVPYLLIGGGILLTASTAVSLVAPTEFTVGSFHVDTGGVRPVIWSSALDAVAEAPVRGVGAAPYLAWAVDPGQPGSEAVLWDAHNAYLSLLAQFGVVGLVLAGLPLWLIGRNLLREGVSTVRIALLVALLSAGVHAVFSANEEARHLWALLGITVLVAHRRPLRVEERSPPGRVAPHAPHS